MKILKAVRTIQYLKLEQIYYQLRYRFARRKPVKFRPETIKLAGSEDPVPVLSMHSSPVSGAVFRSFKKEGDTCIFEFTGIRRQFEGRINWNYSGSGKLWTYNLNYFEFLFSPSCKKEIARSLIHDYIASFSSIKDGLEPYPTSLRIINWIKFMINNHLQDGNIIKALHWQCNYLSENLEYHLMGNHLLENGFALVAGGYYLGEAGYYNTGKYVVLKELNEQILQDGGHFEQSPMYHSILLHRLLDIINLLSCRKKIPGQEQFEQQLRGFAAGMLGWMSNMTFSDGTSPAFNDATEGIAPRPAQLQTYARELGIEAQETPLKESGYRMWRKQEQGIELCFDTGNVTAACQPGHTHADTFGFCLHVNSTPIIVDTGISTYEKNARRQLERSTSAHNTVTVAGMDSSEVWGGFRLGRRARVQIIEECSYRLTARHDGYSPAGCIHQRTFEWHAAELLIEDKLLWKGKSHKALSRLYFHSDCRIQIEGTHIRINDRILIEAKGYARLFSEECQLSQGYNELIASHCITGEFSSKAVWHIRLL